MKTLKYFFLGVLMLSMGTPAVAQDGSDADVAAVTNLIKNRPADFDKQMKAFYGKNKKNPAHLVAFARSFYEANDTANARVYANYALKANKQFGPAYIMLGDIAARGEDGGLAAQFYDQAIYFDPTNPEAYRKYAMVYRKIDPKGAVAKLNELRNHVPDYPIDALIGHISYISNNLPETVEAYDRVDPAKLDKIQMIEYSSSCYILGKYQKGLDIALRGLKTEPRNSTLNRMALFCNTELEHYTEALQYADALFNRSDSANISYMDYVYYGNALSGNNQHEDALAMYQKALEQDFDKDKRAGVLKTMSTAYRGMGDLPNAIKYFEQYLEEVSKPAASDFHSLAQLYVRHAVAQPDDARLPLFQRADQVYEQMQTRYADVDDFISFQRARLGMRMDPETKQLAKPHYERLVAILEAKADRDQTDNTRLIEAYRYFIDFYINVQEDVEVAKAFATKLQEVDPENEIAKIVLAM